ncbi:MAG: hypothetical protein ACOH1R_06755 [Luteimonas sp.]
MRTRLMADDCPQLREADTTESLQAMVKAIFGGEGLVYTHIGNELNVSDATKDAHMTAIKA